MPDRLAINVMVAPGNFDLENCQTMETLEVSQIGPYLSATLGDGIPRDEQARHISRELLHYLTEFSTDEEVWAASRQGNIRRMVPRVLDLMRPVLDTTKAVGVFLDDELTKVEDSKRPLESDHTYMLSLHDLSTLALAYDTNVLHPRFQNPQILARARQLIKPGTSMWLPGELNRVPTFKELIVAAELPGDVKTRGLATITEIYDACSETAALLERSRTIQNSWQEAMVPAHQDITAQLERLLGGKVRGNWEAFYEFLEYGPRDGLHRQFFRSPNKDDAKSVSKTMRLIERFIDRADEIELDPVDSLYQVLSVEQVLIKQAKEIPQVRKSLRGNIPSPATARALKWIQMNASELVASGLISNLPSELRSKVTSILSIVNSVDLDAIPKLPLTLQGLRANIFE